MTTRTPCADPDCGGHAEPERDGPVTYYACVECGHAYGWRISDAVNATAGCPVETAGTHPTYTGGDPHDPLT